MEIKIGSIVQTDYADGYFRVVEIIPPENYDVEQVKIKKVCNGNFSESKQAN